MQIQVSLLFIQFVFFNFSSVFECRSTGNRIEIIKPSTFRSLQADFIHIKTNSSPPSTRSLQAEFVPINTKSPKPISFFRSTTSSISRTNAFIKHNFQQDLRSVFSSVNQPSIFQRFLSTFNIQNSENKIPIKNQEFHEVMNVQIARLRSRRKHRKHRRNAGLCECDGGSECIHGTEAGKFSGKGSCTRAVFVPVMEVA